MQLSEELCICVCELLADADAKLLAQCERTLTADKHYSFLKVRISTNHYTEGDKNRTSSAVLYQLHFRSHWAQLTGTITSLFITCGSHNLQIKQIITCTEE